MENLSELRAWHASLPERIEASLRQDSVEQTYQVLHQHHRTMHRTAFLLAQKQLAVEGHPSLRASYCFVMLGSGARREQALRVDQDHALIYVAHDFTSKQRVHDYFFQLSELVSAYLHEIGYALCSGNVMASNPRWRGTQEDWLQRLDFYQKEPTWEHIRYLLIAADAMPIIGDEQLVFAMRQQAVDYVARSPFMRWKIADQGRADKVMLPLWRKGTVSLKETLYTPLVNSIRLWAHSMDIAEPSTRQRIELISKNRGWSAELAQDATRAIARVLTWRLRLHVDQALHGEEPTDLLHLEKLSGDEWEQMRMTVRFIRKLQLLTGKHFHERRRVDGI